MYSNRDNAVLLRKGEDHVLFYYTRYRGTKAAGKYPDVVVTPASFSPPPDMLCGGDMTRSVEELNKHNICGLQNRCNNAFILFWRGSGEEHSLAFCSADFLEIRLKFLLNFDGNFDDNI